MNSDRPSGVTNSDYRGKILVWLALLMLQKTA
jgi:hypothetical protein